MPSLVHRYLVSVEKDATNVTSDGPTGKLGHLIIVSGWQPVVNARRWVRNG